MGQFAEPRLSCQSGICLTAVVRLERLLEAGTTLLTAGAVFMCNRLSESMGASVLEASAAGQRATDRPIILIEASSMLREECSPCKCDHTIHEASEPANQALDQW
jgi:hypothetical protein